MIPNKWKKHLTLVEFGLKTKEDLANEIHRYSTFQVKNLIKDIKQKMESGENNNFYLISSIPTHDYYKLPNFCAYTPKDLETFQNSLDDDFYHRFSEVWYFEKPIAKESINSIGRISFQNSDLVDSPNYVQCLEQVWNCSHREIEKLTPNSPITYLRANREGWKRRYHIDSLRLFDKEEKENVIEQFYESAKQIEANKEKIESFLEHLKKLGIDELCLEFMLSPKGFRFIDWDTKDDKKVIDSLFSSEKEIVD